MSGVFFSSSFFHKVVELVGGGSVINRAYPVYFLGGFGIYNELVRIKFCVNFSIPELQKFKFYILWTGTPSPSNKYG